MDSFGSTSITSNLGCKKETSAVIESTRGQFFKTYQPQDFNFPDSVMFHIAKNPTTSNLFQKMIQTCKYFFVKNPILVISDLDYSGDGKWKLFSVKRPIDLLKISSKIWITYRFFVLSGYTNNVNKKVVNQNILSSSLMPKLFQCDTKYMRISDQIISNVDVSRLISSAERIDIGQVTVKDKNGSTVDVEKIVEVAVKAKIIKIWSRTTFLNVTSETMKELLQIPHFSKLDQFCLVGIPETFDLETYIGYMKKNKTTKICLSFADSISEAYKNRLEKIIDEIIATETLSYKPPFIHFAGLVKEKSDKLDDIYWSH